MGDVFIFCLFWTFTFCFILYVTVHDTNLNNSQRVILSIALTGCFLFLVFVFGNVWDSSTTTRVVNIAATTELFVSDVILPDGTVMKVVARDNGDVVPVHSIVKHDITENTKFFQITTKPRFSGIAPICSKSWIITARYSEEHVEQ